MLLELKVHNFAIIDNIQISFHTGLNVLSGETGAGKSVLLKSLALLMGQKASAEAIRTGASSASIEGLFDLTARPDLKSRLKDLGIEPDDQQLIVRRVISGDKSKVYLNGSLSTLNTLRDIVSPLIEVAGQAAPLIEMTGQHESRNLLSKHYHLDLLDQYAGVWEKRNQLTQKFSELQQIEKDLADLEKEQGLRLQKIDFLQYQKKEIEALDLKPGEEEDLQNQIKILKNSSRLLKFVDQAEEALVTDDDSAVQRLHVVLSRAVEMASLDPQLSDKFQMLEQAKTLINEAVYDVRKYAGQIDADPLALEKQEERLSQLRKLQKKYGSTVTEILSTLSQIHKELSTLENSDVLKDSLLKQKSTLLKELSNLAKDLSKRRQEAVKLLITSVNEELEDLNMKGVTFDVKLEMTEMTSTGQDDVEFLCRASSKEPPRPLAKVASGGELSRILLSLKRVMGAGLFPRTYLFDEVDTGVSGVTAQKVGEKLREIAKGQQVICVTHLPQVAARGDTHYYIQKSTEKGSVFMEVRELRKQERVQEIARLISGEKISKTSLAHAQELLSQSLH